MRLNDDGVIMLCEQLLKGYRKEYRKHLRAKEHAKIKIMQDDLDYSVMSALLDVMKINKEDLISMLEADNDTNLRSMRKTNKHYTPFDFW